MSRFIRPGIVAHLVAFVVWGILADRLSAEVGDPTLPGHHPLSQAEAGSVLVAEFRCSACHDGVPRSAVKEKAAPDLSRVGTRVSADFLRRYLAAPAVAHPGTTMPDLLAGKTEVERKSIAEALTHFLIAQSQGPKRTDSLEAVDRRQGQALYHSVGCVACHGAKESPPESPLAPPRNDLEPDDDEDPAIAARRKVKPSHVSLGHIATKYSVTSLAEFLFQPLSVRPSGRMPDMKLTLAESHAIAAYLVGTDTPAAKPLEVDAALAEAGRTHFQSLGCAVCHSLNAQQTLPASRSVKIERLDQGCLSTNSDRSPRFELDASQVRAITAALQTPPTVDSDPLAVAKTLTAFRCVACHVRDNYGGVHETHNPYFAGSELKLGDDGRIPPPLTLVGAKLQPAWLKKVLFDGESVRHYMATRMPQYGGANLEHLPAAFHRLDKLSGRELTIPSPESRVPGEREREKLLRPAGRELLGDKGLNCVACHNFNGKASSANQGIDLLTSFPRLQSAWFNAYLRSPGSFRPRTVMPSAWPDGIATHKTILNGDTDSQIEAIWYYLSLGTSAADPPGIRDAGTKLVVDGQAAIHRGRSRVAGYRGIAVGLPEQLHYAFNAETGTLSAIWQGDFVQVNWSGQGSGNFNPASESILLAQDVSFATLANDNDPWPLLPVMTSEAKTNPNPLYPKNVGYQFRGYYLGELSIPTFQYRSGSIDIEDRSVAVGEVGPKKLRRELRLKSPTPTAQTVWFRALVGEITRESEHVFRSGRLRLTLPSGETRLRPLPAVAPPTGAKQSGAPQTGPMPTPTPADAKRYELLIKLTVPQGESSLELLYEPLPR
jgi:mono/diheme cytochrome c family protein